MKKKRNYKNAVPLKKNRYKLTYLIVESLRILSNWMTVI